MYSLYKNLIYSVLVFSFLVITGCGNSPYTRMLKYGDSDIYDYNIFPYRELVPSNSPVPIITDTNRVNEKFRTLINKRNLPKLLQNNRTLSFLVIHNDTIITQYYFNGSNSNFYSQYFSMSKSVVSLLIGCAIDDKLIQSENDPVTKYIPEFKKSGFKNITISDLLSMRAPVYYKESDNPLGKHAWFYYSSTLEEDILNLTADEDGEKEFVYRSANSAILGLVLKRVLETETLTQYTQRKIWSPLGMESRGLWNIDHSPDGIERVWCCLSGTAKDFARIGLLYNNLGTWNNKQIVSKEWIEKTLEPIDGNKDELGYNLGWWMLPAKHAAIAIGKDGQYTYICPEKNIVIVRIGEKEGDIEREGWLKLFGEISDCY